MNRGDSLANQDSVSRGCRLRAFRNNKVRSSEFSPMPKDKNCLSVDWVECAFADQDQRCLEGTVSRQGNNLRIKPQKLAILNVGEIKDITVKDASLDVIYSPTGRGRNRNLCHCRITGMTGGPADQDFQQELADLANLSMFVDLPPTT